MNSFGNNALQRARDLALKEYETLTVTREGLEGFKAELAREKNGEQPDAENEKDLVQINMNEEINEEIVDRIEDVQIEQPVKNF